MDGFESIFSDGDGNIIGGNGRIPDETLRKLQERAIDDMRKCGETMDFVVKNFGEHDPSQVMAWLSNLIVSASVATSKDLADPSRPTTSEKEILYLKKRADYILKTLMKNTKGPIEALASLALAFNMLYSIMKVIIEQEQDPLLKDLGLDPLTSDPVDPNAPFDLFNEIKRNQAKYQKPDDKGTGSPFGLGDLF